jgi:hypothetical protein
MMVITSSLLRLVRQPFVIAFAVSVLFLNHAKVDTGARTSVETFRDLRVPAGARWNHSRTSTRVRDRTMRTCAATGSGQKCGAGSLDSR